MLTFALCIIAFFIGIFLMAWLVLRTIDQLACTIGNSLSTVVKGCFSKSPEPQVQYERTEKPNVDPGMMIKIMRFTFDFAMNTIEEFHKKFDDFEADLWKKKDDENAVFNQEEISSVEDTRTERDLWQDYFKKQSESLTNNTGTPQEHLKKSAGPPKELLDNQGVPKIDELTVNSQKS